MLSTIEKSFVDNISLYNALSFISMKLNYQLGNNKLSTNINNVLHTEYLNLSSLPQRNI